MNSNGAFRFSFLGILLFSLFCGCGQPRPEGLPDLYPVTLKFTQEGAPCADAFVTLISESGVPWTVGGRTDAGGSVTLQTHGRYLGAPAGKYKITVTKTETEFTGPPPKEMGDVQASNSYSLIDSIYTISATTTLVVEIGTGKNSFPPFDLGKKVRELMKPPGA